MPVGLFLKLPLITVGLKISVVFTGFFTRLPHIDDIVGMVAAEGFFHQLQGAFLALAAAEADLQAILEFIVVGYTAEHLAANLLFSNSLAKTNIHFSTPDTLDVSFLCGLMRSVMLMIMIVNKILRENYGFAHFRGFN
jgi:hypothetical protein